jgi:hypothetical protein
MSQFGSRIKTPAIESVLNESNHPDTEDAIQELHMLRELNYQLTTMFSAVKQQSDHTATNIVSLLAAQKTVRQILPSLVSLSLVGLLAE